MSRLRQLLMGGALAALVVTALGAPVAAADTQGTLAIVNGIPGKRVDVCINGNEIASGLRYGRAVLRNVISTGNKNLKFYERDPRECRGNVLAQDNFPLAAAEDLTIVATKNAPKVATFSNAGLGEIPPAGTPIAQSIVAFRHAADFIASFKSRLGRWPSQRPRSTPSLDPIWTHEDQVGHPRRDRQHLAGTCDPARRPRHGRGPSKSRCRRATATSGSSSDRTPATRGSCSSTGSSRTSSLTAASRTPHHRTRPRGDRSGAFPRSHS